MADDKENELDNATNVSKRDQFLLEEYKNANQLTYHIDELRNKLTSFYLAFTGIAVGGLTLLIKGEASKFPTNPELLVALSLIVIALIGLSVVCVLAKLRRVQIEHFRIINNIRQHFIGEDKMFWNVVQLSKSTLPKPSRYSGTYYWLIMIMLVNSAISTTAIFLLIDAFHYELKYGYNYPVLIASVVLIIALEDKIYFTMSKPPELINYMK